MIARKIFQTGAVQSGTLFFGIVTGIFLTRLLGPEGRGVYAIFRANAEFLVLFLGFGMGSVITYYISNRKIPVEKILGIAAIGFLSGLLVVAALLTAAPYIGLLDLAFPDGYQGVWFRVFLFGLFAVSNAAVILTGLLNGRGFFSETNLAKVAVSVSLLAAVVFLFFFFRMDTVFANTVNVFGVTLATSLLSLILLAAFFIKRYRKELTVSFAVGGEVKLAAGFIYLVYFGELINFFNYRLDIWLVEYFESSYQLGLYTLAVSVSQMLWLIAIPITIVLMPYLNDPDKQSEAKGLFFFIRGLRSA